MTTVALVGAAILGCLAGVLVPCSGDGVTGNMTRSFTLHGMDSVGEGVEYHPGTDQVIVSSLFTGSLYGAPNAQPAPEYAPVVFTQEDLTLVYDASADDEVNNTLGLQVVGGTEVYAAFGPYPGTGAPTGFIAVSMDTGELTRKVVFNDPDSESGDLTNPNVGIMAANDLICDEATGNCFTTDYSGGQVILTTPNGTSVVFSNSSLLAAQANGIEFTAQGDLIVGLIVDGQLAKLPIDGPEDIALIPITPAPAVAGLGISGVPNADGIIFVGDLLYVVGDGFDRLYVLSSNDDWETATMDYVYQANCEQGFPSTAAFTGADVVAYCTNAFGDNPYNITRLAEAPQELSTADDNGDADDDDGTDDKNDGHGDDDDDDDDDDSDNETTLVVVISVLAVLLAVSLAGLLLLYRRVRSQESRKPLLGDAFE